MIEPNSFINGDCMNYLPEYPDNYFDLAIVDPPYGSGNDTNGTGLRFHGGDRRDKYKNAERTGGTWASKYGKKIVTWDIAPRANYFNELFRVSKNQIIWGG